jgi:hypothetical protein
MRLKDKLQDSGSCEQGNELSGNLIHQSAFYLENKLSRIID